MRPGAMDERYRRMRDLASILLLPHQPAVLDARRPRQQQQRLQVREVVQGLRCTQVPSRIRPRWDTLTRDAPEVQQLSSTSSLCSASAPASCASIVSVQSTSGSLSSPSCGGAELLYWWREQLKVVSVSPI
jgi:hypothetical protein